MEPLSDKPVQAESQIQTWVPVGTQAARAQEIMQQHGFTCDTVTNANFADLSGVDFVYCRYSKGNIVQRHWMAALILKEQAVSSIRVQTALTGP
jgi:hypothetical protein